VSEVVFTDPFLRVFSALSAREQAEIMDKVELLEMFPRMYKRIRGGEFAGCHVFIAGNWLVYYKIRSGTVYLRNVWPARIPDRG
jgi:hypothetical protein